MRILTIVALSLAACQTTAIPTDAELATQLGQRAVAFAIAMENGSAAEGLPLAASSAAGFFAAQVEFEKLQWGEDERPDLAPVTLQSTKRSGDRGVAVVTIGEDKSKRDVALHFDLENNIWGVVGFGAADEAQPMLFADRETKIRERLASAIAETKPHPELGPIVAAYLDAAANRDRTLMMAKMTAECRQGQSEKRAFTAGFLADRFRVKRWQFAGHEVDGDTATQRLRTLLELPNAETDNEPMTFEFERRDIGWVLTRIR